MYTAPDTIRSNACRPSSSSLSMTEAIASSSLSLHILFHRYPSWRGMLRPMLSFGFPRRLKEFSAWPRGKESDCNDVHYYLLSLNSQQPPLLSFFLISRFTTASSATFFGGMILRYTMLLSFFNDLLFYYSHIRHLFLWHDITIYYVIILPLICSDRKTDSQANSLDFVKLDFVKAISRPSASQAVQ